MIDKPGMTRKLEFEEDLRAIYVKAHKHAIEMTPTLFNFLFGVKSTCQVEVDDLLNKFQQKWGPEDEL